MYVREGGQENASVGSVKSSLRQEAGNWLSFRETRGSEHMYVAM